MPVDTAKRNGRTTEQTGQQTLHATAGFDGELPKFRESTTLTFNKVRLMRKQPTIRFLRMFASAPIVSAGWSYNETDDAPEGALDFVKETFEPQRIHILQNAMNGQFDFGWQGFEKIFGVKEDGTQTLRRMKPLLQDITTIFVFENGQFAGLKNEPVSGANVFLELPFSWLVNQDQEGGNLYGLSTMASCEQPYNDWINKAQSSHNYDRMIAGGHWVVTYPPGESKFGGVMTDNGEIAKKLVNTLEGSGSIAMPASMAQWIDEMNNHLVPNAWEVKLIQAQGSSKAQFIDGQKYNDALFARAFGIPERSVFEGEFGTKAEAAAHIDVAIANMETRHDLIVQSLNWHVVNQLLRFNYGPQADGTVWISPSPLADPQKSFLRDLWFEYMKTPDGQVESAATIAWQQVLERIGVPIDETSLALV